jgi:hypothetical protein
MPIIVNIGLADYSAKYVRVDRMTNWGNPFVMKWDRDDERDRVCDLFVEYASWRLSVEPDWLKPLKGSNLGCWCAPKRCHADTLLFLANR